MAERPGYVPIVREPDVQRLTVASQAVLAEFDRVRALVGHRPKMLAYLYAATAVRADDDHGRGSGLVVQADELRWGELLELIRVAEERLAAGRHTGLDDWHPGCRDCQAVLALARIRSRYHYRTVGRPGPAGGTVPDGSPPAGDAAPPSGTAPSGTTVPAGGTADGPGASGVGFPGGSGTGESGRGPP